MADTSVRPPLTGRPRSDQDKEGNGLLLAGLLLAGAGVALYEHRKHGGGSSGSGHTLPQGLYTDCADTNAASCTIWYVPPAGNVRYGVSTPAQLARCFNGMPVQSQATLTSLGGFGNGDDPACGYIPTVGDVSQCSSCPPGSPGA